MCPPLTIWLVFTETPIYYRYTNLLQIHFPKVKPIVLKKDFFLRLKGLKKVLSFEKFSRDIG